MQKILMIATIFGSSLLFAPVALAAPNSNNPNVFANYSSGTHGIAGETATHTGSDIVTQSGNSGNFQQWFSGTGEGGVTEGDHSVWKLSNNGNCPSNAVAETVGPNNFWGDYLVQGATYCVTTNDFTAN